MIDYGIAARLRALRKEQGVSQQFVAKNIGVPSTKMCLLEKGKAVATEEILKKLSTFFNVSISELKTGVPEHEDPETFVNDTTDSSDMELDQYVAKIIRPQSDIILFTADSHAYLFQTRRKFTQAELTAIMREAKKKLTKTKGRNWTWEDLIDLIGSLTTFTLCPHTRCDLIQEKVTAVDLQKTEEE